MELNDLWFAYEGLFSLCQSNGIAKPSGTKSDPFLEEMGIEKGIMQLVDRDRAELLYAAMRDRIETPVGPWAIRLPGSGPWA